MKKNKTQILPKWSGYEIKDARLLRPFNFNKSIGIVTEIDELDGELIIRFKPNKNYNAFIKAINS